MKISQFGTTFFAALTPSRWRTRKSTLRSRSRAAKRRVFFESLEDRRLLAAVPLNLTSVLTEDIIVNRANGVTDTSQTAMDRSNWAYMTQSYATFLGGTAGPGMPDNGLIPATTFHPEIQLPYNNANYGNNGSVIRTSTGSFTFGVPQDNYNYIHIAGASTEGLSNFRLSLAYTTGSPVTTAIRTMPDWFNEIAQTQDQYYLLNGMDRADFRGNGIFENANNPAVFGFRFAADPTRVLSSVTVEKTSSAGFFVFFGAYGDNTNITPTLTVNNSTVTVLEGQTANSSGTMADSDGTIASVSASVGTIVNNATAPGAGRTFRATAYSPKR